MSPIQTYILIAGAAIIALIVILSLVFKGNRRPEILPDIQFSQTGTVESLGESTTTLTPETAPPGNSEPENEIMPVPDHAVLKRMYMRAAKQHNRQLRNADLNIIIFFVIQGLLLLFLAVIGNTADDGINILILLMGLILYVPLLAFYIYSRNRSVAKYILSDKYVRLQQTQFPAIWTVCRDLMKKMELQDYKLNLLYVKTNAFEASVVTEGGAINLLLSRAIISYFQQCPKDVESILGHEFGHVYQGDTKMMIVNRKTLQIPAIIGTISLFMVSIVTVVLLLEHKGLPQVGGNIMLVMTYWGLISKRRQSEFFADLASYVFVENSTIELLLEKYMPQKGTFSYPPASERLKFLNLVKEKALAEGVKNNRDKTSS